MRKFSPRFWLTSSWTLWHKGVFILQSLQTPLIFSQLISIKRILCHQSFTFVVSRFYRLLYMPGDTHKPSIDMFHHREHSREDMRNCARYETLPVVLFADWDFHWNSGAILWPHASPISPPHSLASCQNPLHLWWLWHQQRLHSPLQNHGYCSRLMCAIVEKE